MSDLIIAVLLSVLILLGIILVPNVVFPWVVQSTRIRRLRARGTTIPYSVAISRIRHSEGMLVIDNWTSRSVLYWLDGHDVDDLEGQIDKRGYLVNDANRDTVLQIENDPHVKSSVKYLIDLSREGCFIDYD